MSEYNTVVHEFEPIWNENSKILILGSLPSVKSREEKFYYGHPMNRFWKVIAEITDSKIPQNILEKKELILKNNLAIWDVIKQCEIVGSSDSTIKNVIVNDVDMLIKKSNIKIIAGNGAKACELYDKYLYKETGIKIIKMPSTSPANAAWNIDKLCVEYKKLLNMI